MPSNLHYVSLIMRGYIVEALVQKNEDEARRTLRSYAGIYVREEIQAEAIVRRVGPFHRFLPIAAQHNSQIIEFANISRESGVPMSTVKEYYTILEDTLIGEFLWPFDRSERRKARPKFYFFDTGVVRAIQNRLSDPPTPSEQGDLFETWFFRELVKIRDYQQKDHLFSFWRKGPHEIDFIIEGGHGPLLAIECKSGKTDMASSTIEAFKKDFPNVPLIVCSLTDKHTRKLTSGVEIFPVTEMIQKYRDL